MSEDTVLVLGAGYGALAVVKALAKEGIRVVLFYSASDDHALYSRFVSERVKISNPIDDSVQLLEILMDPKNKWDGRLLIPTLDEYVVFLSQNFTNLKKRYVFTVQEWEITKKVVNKNLLYLQAQQAGVPTPKYFLPDSDQFLQERQNEIPYPCILKPSDTHLFDRIYGKKNLMVTNFKELVEGFHDIQKHNLEVMISEIIPGEDTAIFSYRSYMDDKGELLAELCTQKIRQYPPRFGQGAVQKTIPMIKEVRDQALRLLSSLHYQGEASTEFKFDCRDEKYKLTDINARPPVVGGIYLKAGVNIPYITFLDQVKNIHPALSAYRPEVYWINNYWEVINFIQSLKSGNLNLKAFLEPYLKEKVFAISFFDDPIHFFIETYFNMRRAFKKAKKRNLL